MQHYPQPTPDAHGQPNAGVLPTPQVEVVTHADRADPSPSAPWYRARRLHLFLAVFLLILIPGLAWDFLRPPVYRASASLLTAVSLPSRPTVGPVEADVQHVTIQRQVLLGMDLIKETFELVRQRTEAKVASPDALAAMLDVRALPGTNLVELSARGSDPELLSLVVNSWIDGYLSLRQRVLEREVGDRRRALEAEIDALTEKVESSRSALDAFRAAHDIVTLERNGNEALARLAALTEDLNRVRDEAVEAEARATAIREAIARGEPVVPPSEQSNLEQLEVRASELRARLIELRKRFTPLYLENEPDLRVIPAQLEKLEGEIAAKQAQGGEAMLALAQQELAQARQRVLVLEQELIEQKTVANRFTTDFARYQSMQEEFAKLEVLQRDQRARLVELEAQGVENYPPVEVIEAAHPPASPIAPHYWRDAGWVLLVASIAGLGAVLLLEFLTRRPREEVRPAPVTGVRVFAGPSPVAPGLDGGGAGHSTLGQHSAPAIPGGGRPALPEAAPQPRDRELIVAEVAALWDLADPMSRELMGLLLSGLTLEECARLEAESFDLDARVVWPSGEGGRALKLAAPLSDLLAACRPVPLWSSGGAHLTPDELSLRLRLLAHDAGISQPDEVTADALRHTYVAYLVRQGARLTQLERLIGVTAPSQLATYAGLAPAGAAKSLEDLDLTYPALRAVGA